MPEQNGAGCLPTRGMPVSGACRSTKGVCLLGEVSAYYGGVCLLGGIPTWGEVSAYWGVCLLPGGLPYTPLG